MTPKNGRSLTPAIDELAVAIELAVATELPGLLDVAESTAVKFSAATPATPATPREPRTQRLRIPIQGTAADNYNRDGQCPEAAGAGPGPHEIQTPDPYRAPPDKFASGLPPNHYIEDIYLTSFSHRDLTHQQEKNWA